MKTVSEQLGCLWAKKKPIRRVDITVGMHFIPESRQIEKELEGGGEWTEYQIRSFVDSKSHETFRTGDGKRWKIAYRKFKCQWQGLTDDWEIYLREANESDFDDGCYIYNHDSIDASLSKGW